MISNQRLTGHQLLRAAQFGFREPFLSYGPAAWVELGPRLGKGLLIATPLRLIFVSEANGDPIPIDLADVVGTHLKKGLVSATLTLTVEAGPPPLSFFGRKKLISGMWALADETLLQRRRQGEAGLIA